MNKLVALDLPPGPEFVDALRRAWDQGDAVLPLDTRLSPSVRAHLAERLGEGSEVNEGDALVVATSGTTGDPKGVVLTHDAIGASARMTNAALQVNEADHWLSVLPLAHIGGLSVVTRALHAGTKLTVLPRFDADAVEDVGSTLISIVPTLLTRLDTCAFRRVLLGGASPPADLPENVVTTYGMTETASGVVYSGRPLEGVSMRIDEDSQLWIASPTLLRCYRDGSDPKVDGWLPTGDAGSIRDDATVEVYGRIAEVINTGGEKVWPTGVERVIDSHPSVRASLVYGEPDGEWGHRVVAMIELNSGVETPSLTEIKELVTAQIAPYAAPKQLLVTPSLARTPSGKLRRR